MRPFRLRVFLFGLLIFGPRADSLPESAAPISLPAVRFPSAELEKNWQFEISVTGGEAPLEWRIQGSWPRGFIIQNGIFFLNAVETGKYSFKILVTDVNDNIALEDYSLWVLPPNLAHIASQIITSASSSNADLFLKYGMSPPSDIGSSPEVLRDEKWTGPESVLYNLREDGTKWDYYGYLWNHPQHLGVLCFRNRIIHEIGGWFESVRVEYLDQTGTWREAEDLTVTPAFYPNTLPDSKDHSIEHLVEFNPIQTQGIRLIGSPRAGLQKRPFPPFTAISELKVSSPILREGRK